MLKPLTNKVLLKIKEAKQTTESGIIISNNTKEKTKVGEIISIGKKVEEQNELLQEGKFVIIKQYAGIELTYKEEEYLIIDYEDILAIIE